jgi:hypothetical protein
MNFKTDSSNRRTICWLSLLLFVALFFSSIGSVDAQQQKGIPSDGKDFYIGFMPSSIRCPAVQPFIHVYALITSYYDNSVRLDYFDNNGVELQGRTYQLLGKHSIQVDLDQVSMRPSPGGEVAEYKACHIVARQPINVQYYSTGPASGGMFLALPTPALGKKYEVASYGSNTGTGAGGNRFSCNSTYLDSASSEFMIIAASDNTTVTITPNATTYRLQRTGATMGKNSGGGPSPFQITLNRGMIYWVKSMQDEDGLDESTSEVESDKPVAVLAGNESAFLTSTPSPNQPKRDLSIEQMVPVEFWDGKDNLSMPFVDSQTAQSGDDNIGEAYRVFTATPGGSKITWSEDNVRSSKGLTVDQYSANPMEWPNVQNGINATSEDGSAIFVEQYDYRQHNGNEPFPTPSQMNIVPISRYRKSFLWMVPDDAAQVHKRHFINVIAQTSQMTKIMVSKNGGAPSPLNSLGSFGKTANFPGQSLRDPIPLTGKRFEVSPGSYYATGDSAFVVYQYGNLGLDPDNDLGDNDDDDYYFSYAAPCGQSFGVDGSGSSTIKVDTTCGGWNFHVTDSLPLDNGLADIQLLNDPVGVYTRPGKVSFNTELDPSGYQVQVGSLSADFGVKVSNPLKDAYAAIYVVNRAGNDTVIEVSYRAPKLKLTPDSANFRYVIINGNVCTDFVLKNTGKATDRIFTIIDAKLLLNDGNFAIATITPKLPKVLKPGDSIKFTACYTALDTGLIHIDTIILKTDCFEAPVQLLGSGITPIIKATDIDFGQVQVGTTSCKTATITNVGTAPLVITKNWLLNDTVNFSFPDSTKLPATIQPGESITVTFCFHPHKAGSDTGRCDWGNNLVPPFLHQIKDFTILRGKATKSSVLWVPSRLADTVTCEQRDTFFHVNLTNIGNAQATIDELKIIGPDAAEYKIIAIQNNYSHPKVNQPINGGDTIWVDIEFAADLTKPAPKTYANRSATLIMTTTKNDSSTVDLESTVLHAELVADTKAIDFGRVVIGVLQTKKVILTNPGTAPLLVSSIVFPRPPIQSISNLIAGDIIPPGGSDTITVNAELLTPTDTLVDFTIDGLTNCPKEVKISVHLQAATLQVQGTGKTFDSTFLYCRNDTGTTNAINIGSTPVTLIKAEIVTDLTHPDGSQFVFTDGSHYDSVGVVLPSGGLATFKVLYIPSQKDGASALIRYTWDTSGVSWQTFAVLKGTGVLLHDSLSAQAIDTKPITAKTGDYFDLPIRLLQALPPTGQVYGVKFDVTFREDLFHFNGATAQGGMTIVNTPTAVSIGNGLDRISVVAMSTTPITSVPLLATLKFRVMVAKDLMSDFVISDAAYLDANKDSLCYVINQSVPGSFTPIDLCGDPTTRTFLNGNLRSALLAMIIPNPATQEARVRFDVNVQDAPVTIEVYNMLGQIVETVIKDVPYAVGSYVRKIDLADLPSGTYHVRLTSREWTDGKVMIVSK